MESLTHFMRSTPDNLGRRLVLIQHLKEAQHNLMNVIMSIVHDAIPEEVDPRDFRGKYPDDVSVDMISGEHYTVRLLSVNTESWCTVYINFVWWHI